MKLKLKQSYKLAVNLAFSILLLLGILYLVGFENILTALLSLKLELFVLALCVYVVMVSVMSYRIKLVLASIGERLGVVDIMPSNLAGLLASDFTPARVGYFFTALSLSSKFNISLEKTMVSIFGPQLFDFLIKACSAALLIMFLADKLGSGNVIVNAVVVCIVFAGIIFAGLMVFYPPALEFLRFLEQLPVVPLVFAFLRKMHQHAGKIFAVKWQIISLTIITWLLKGAEWFILAKALNITIFGSTANPLLDLAFMMIFQASVTILQFLPLPTLAGAGASEAGFAAVLVIFGVPLGTSVAFGFLTRLVMIVIDSFSLPVVLGYVHKYGFEKMFSNFSH